MSNIEHISISCYGTCDAVLQFLSRIQCFCDRNKEKAGWANCLLAENRAAVIADIEQKFASASASEKRWAGAIIYGWPESESVVEACVEDNVSVKLSACDCNNGTEYQTIFKSNGATLDKCYRFDMCRCPKCGILESFSCFESERDARCPQCGHCGLMRLKRYLQESIYTGPKVWR